MTAIEYLDILMSNAKSKVWAFRWISIIMLFLGTALLLIPFLNLISDDLSVQYAQYGFGFLNMLTPIYLNGHIYKGKKQVLDLEMAKSEALRTDDETVREKIIEGILKQFS